MHHVATYFKFAWLADIWTNVHLSSYEGMYRILPCIRIIFPYILLFPKIITQKIEGCLIHGRKLITWREQNGMYLASVNRLPLVRRLSFLQSGDLASSNHKPYGTYISWCCTKQMEHTSLEVEPIGSDSTGTQNVPPFWAKRLNPQR